MLTVLLACSFVDPVAPREVPTLPDAERAVVDAQRDALLRTDAGVELWRALDAHGTAGRWALLGEPRVELADGTVLTADDPRHAMLLAPFSGLPYDGEPGLAYDDLAPLVTIPTGQLRLDPATRRVLAVTDEAGTWELSDHRPVDRMVLPHTLVDPAGTVHEVARYAFADGP